MGPLDESQKNSARLLTGTVSVLASGKNTEELANVCQGRTKELLEKCADGISKNLDTQCERNASLGPKKGPDVSSETPRP